jgi:carbon-monoxide dehydrogenase catalytic subunit
MAEKEERPRSSDPATLKALETAQARQMKTVWDRYESMQPQCRFGSEGLCCRLCNMGPCRITPKNTCGVCGATADTIAARGIARAVASGVAAHSDHARDVAHAVLAMAEGEAKDYRITDEAKLRRLAVEFEIGLDGKDSKQIAKEVALAALAEFGKQDGELRFLKRAPQRRQQTWRRVGIVPRSVDREVVELMHRTHMGVDADYRNMMKQAMRCALADGWGGSMIATDLQDVMFGSPEPLRARVNLGVLKEDQVNIVIHGHEPLLSEMIAEAAKQPDLIELAKKNGAKGINLGGICCTAVELLMRRGIPAVGNFLQQELAIATGAVEAMVVDVQCLMPSLPDAASCFHTKLITTSPKARFAGVEHIEFSEEHALDVAREIVKTAIENFPRRDPNLVAIPQESNDLVAGFTAEYVFKLLGGRFRPSYRPLNDGIMLGRLRGVVGVVGCCNPRFQHDYHHVELVKELIRQDVLVVESGCAATACAKVGLLQPEAASKYAGRGLQEICEAVGIPPVLHVGSCVDNSRILIACCQMVQEGGLGEDISELPVAAAAPEWMSEKAIAIGLYAVASGILTVFGSPLQVEGAPELAAYLRDGIKDDVGGFWAFESDPKRAAEIIIEHLNSKREALKLKPMMYPTEAVAA